MESKVKIFIGKGTFMPSAYAVKEWNADNTDQEDLKGFVFCRPMLSVDLGIVVIIVFILFNTKNLNPFDPFKSASSAFHCL